MESVTIGVAVAFYDNRIVLQALIITIVVFLGLTLFTFQSKVCSLVLLRIRRFADPYLNNSTTFLVSPHSCLPVYSL
jgi:hypothetical protein